MTILCNEMSYQNFGRCICLENGVIRLIATLDVGPRIIYFGTRGNGNILFEDVRRDFCELTKGYGTWYAYGGHRLWTAPEVMPETDADTEGHAVRKAVHSFREDVGGQYR